MHVAGIAEGVCAGGHDGGYLLQVCVLVFWRGEDWVVLGVPY